MVYQSPALATLSLTRSTCTPAESSIGIWNQAAGVGDQENIGDTLPGKLAHNYG